MKRVLDLPQRGYYIINYSPICSPLPFFVKTEKSTIQNRSTERSRSLKFKIQNSIRLHQLTSILFNQVTKSLESSAISLPNVFI